MRRAKYPKPLCVALEAAIYDAIKERSDKKGASMAEMTRDILTQYFKWEEEVEKQLLINKADEEISGGADNFSESLEELVREPQKGDVSR
jgi:plasmid stability protein